MAVPNTFASATTSIPLANLDSNFSYYDGAFSIASNVFTFLDTVQFQDVAAPTKVGAFSFSGITAGTTVTYTFPNVTGTLATLGNLAQSFAGTVTVANAFTVTGTTTSTSIQSTQSTGTITVGGTAGTGAITVGQSTGAQTLNFGTGATTNATTKAVNIGTAGVSGSITNITIGSATSGATGTTTINSLETVNKGLRASAPVTVNAATYTQLISDFSLLVTTTAPTITLLAAASYPGKILYINNITATAVISASANVIPLGSATAGTAILAATAGKFAMLQSNGTNWVTIMAN